MSQASDYLENKLLDHTLRNTAFTSPTAVYVGLFLSTTDAATTVANLEAGTLTDEVSGNGYARVQATFGAAHATNGSITTSGNVTFAAANGGDFGTITHIAILDQFTGGNVLFYGALTTSKQIQDGDTFQITTGNLTVTLA